MKCGRRDRMWRRWGTGMEGKCYHDALNEIFKDLKIIIKIATAL